MKRLVTILTASLMASSLIAAPGFAQGNSGNGNGGGNENGGANANSASDFAPGQMKGDDMEATDFAPGQRKADDESAKEFAPGQLKKDADVDPEVTASTGKSNFGTVISSIRAGKDNLSQLAEGATVEIVDVDDLIEGNNRSALDNALDDNQTQIEALQTDLTQLDADLDLDDLDEDDIDNAVAARVEDDGSLTVFVDN